MAILRGNNQPGGRAGSSTPGPDQVSMIGPGCIIEGSVHAQYDARISGRVNGKVRVDGRLVLTPEGYVEGEVEAGEAEVAGRVRGDLVVRDRIVLRPQAVVEGNITTAKIIVEDGALFTGRCAMINASDAESPAEARAETETRSAATDGES